MADQQTNAGMCWTLGVFFFNLLVCPPVSLKGLIWASDLRPHVQAVSVRLCSWLVSFSPWFCLTFQLAALFISLRNNYNPWPWYSVGLPSTWKRCRWSEKDVVPEHHLGVTREFSLNPQEHRCILRTASMITAFLLIEALICSHSKDFLLFVP